MPGKATAASTSSVDPRRLVRVEPERVRDVSSTDYPGHYPNEDHSWDLEKFKKNLKVQVTQLSNRSIEFDLVGVDASIANAFRRILIAEVPSIAIEHVYVWNNNSVIVDEVLSHRIGLIPLNVDPAMLEVKEGASAQATDRNTLVFRLQLTCERKKGPKPTSENPSPDELYINHELKSSHLEWVPQGEQAEVFADNPPAPTNPDIVLAKLRPGQEVDMELHAVKSVGKDHAKFSPVATASYRLLPHISLGPKPIPAGSAAKFAACFSPGVIRVDPRTQEVSVDEKAIRGESMSREVFRHPEFEGCVKLGRVRDHFLFKIESEGAYAPERLFMESVKVLRGKIAAVRAAALRLQDGAGAGGDEDVTMEGD